MSLTWANASNLLRLGGGLGDLGAAGSSRSKVVRGNPLTDTTGAFAHVNNHGPVFFVAGAFPPFGPATVEGSFSVEEGMPLLAQS